jgi:hypothetical protein
MSAKPWSKAQAKNNKKFQAKLDRITNYVIEGDWHGSYGSRASIEGDEIINDIATKESLPFDTLEFILLPGGLVTAKEGRIDETGNIEIEEFIVGIQPLEGTFYMIGIEDNDIVFGSINKKSGILSVTELEQAEVGDEAGICIAQYTNLAM